MLKGGCFCGQLRYEASALPLHPTLCHCSICQRISAAPVVAWFSVPRHEFRFVRGEPTRFKTTATVTRSFCPRCGTPVTFDSSDDAHAIGITLCSLDRPELLAPKEHIWVRSRQPWLELSDDLERFEQGRPTL